jgi:hypothetical protein
MAVSLISLSMVRDVKGALMIGALGGKSAEMQKKDRKNEKKHV